ncbi:MAG: site-2 protease family protein [Balneolaceae bacterium]|nr:site-2 protease family protein [Balneolaceae bacterium]
MNDRFSTPDYSYGEFAPEPPRKQTNPNQYDRTTILKHTGLFLLTFATVTFMSSLFVGQGAAEESFWPLLWDGAFFALLFLAFLATHEFGHFIAAQIHRIRVTLPYFIPVPLGIGTVGAVIRIKEKIDDTYKMFDIGIAGPLAGFVVSLFLLVYGFATLPEPDFINNFSGHEATKEYVAEYGTYPDAPLEETGGEVLVAGETLLYSFLAQYFENVPPMWEMYHYPFLFAGWLGLFFTALNLTPVGQLDGGHILYSLIGYKKHKLVARVFFAILTVLAGIESIPYIHSTLGSWDNSLGTMSWLLWAVVLFLLLRRAYRDEHKWIAPVMVLSLALSAGYLFLYVGNLTTHSSLVWIFWSFFLAFLVGIEHPPALYERPLDPKRRLLGWLSMGIFILCISLNPLYLI